MGIKGKLTNTVGEHSIEWNHTELRSILVQIVCGHPPRRFWIDIANV